MVFIQFVIGMIFLSGSRSVHFLLFVYIAVVIYLVIKRRLKFHYPV